MVGGGGHEPWIWWVKAWGCTVSVIVTSSHQELLARIFHFSVPVFLKTLALSVFLQVTFSISNGIIEGKIG
jgi:hypothetical protein